jgi:ATP-dependent helicase Lhr and Lhr-like helicase
MSTAIDLPNKPGAFSRLERKLQEPLYRMRWTQLRPIQVEAIHEIFDGQGDLIVAAATASGKTEAAFLPILSKMVEEPSGGVRAIYAGPLKALINDQFLRLERLCEIAEIPVHKWHGDVGPGPKRRLLESPSGVLLITPESIESLFVNHSDQLASLFGKLEFVVIDEMHAFLGTERGAHLRSLICRLSNKSRSAVRVVGLSATLGDPKAARSWLRPRDAEGVRVIEDQSGKSIRLRISGYSMPPVREPLEDEAPEDEALEVDLPKHDDLADALERDVFEAFVNRTALIFGNNKKRIEQCADAAKREAARRKMPDRFRVHHGSLSKAEREETEDALRSDQPTATFCSSTLEMGIDVGSVKAVGQIGAPWSVSSMVQRLGRSGRKEGEPSEMRVYIEQDEPVAETSLVERLFPELLQAAAMTELLLAKWREPPDVDRAHLSTLVQQILSVITERGGQQADPLYDVLCKQGGFPNIDTSTFVEVLRSLGTHDLIEQTPDGLLVLGLRGEKIVRKHDFYVSFHVSDEYRVSHEGRLIGSIARPPSVDLEAFIILAGERWRIVEIDDQRREILVEPSPGGAAPSFMSQSGMEIHPRVHEVMRELLSRDDVPVYLDPGASAMLEFARKTARDARILDSPFLVQGREVIWFPWTGTRVVRTLWLLGKFAGIRSVDSDAHDLSLVFRKTSADEVRAIYLRFLQDCPSAETLARQVTLGPKEKYEPYLTDSLISRTFAREALDIPGALEVIRIQLADSRDASRVPILT